MPTNKQTIENFLTKQPSKNENTTGTIFSEYNKIYSYGVHFLMGVIENGYLFINDYNYSNTTAKHLNLLQNLGSYNYKILTLPYWFMDTIETNTFSEGWIAKKLSEDKKEAEQVINRRRKEELKESDKAKFNKIIDNIKEYFYIKPNKLNLSFLDSLKIN